MAQVTTKKRKPVIVKAPPYPKGYQRQFEKVLEGMVKTISKDFSKGTLDKLNKDVISEFEYEEGFKDSQDGNYGKVFVRLANSVSAKIRKQFSDKRIRKEVVRIFSALNRVQGVQFYKGVSKVTAISVEDLLERERLNPQFNAMIEETALWASKLRDDTLGHFTANTLRAMTEGGSIEDVLEEYNEEVEKRKNHAKFVARSQVASFNGLSNRLRYQNLGITKAVWRTVGGLADGVRKSHVDRDGKTFDLAKGLYSSIDGKYLLPGVDYQCRCIADPIIPGVNNG